MVDVLGLRVEVCIAVALSLLTIQTLAPPGCVPMQPPELTTPPALLLWRTAEGQPLPLATALLGILFVALHQVFGVDAFARVVDAGDKKVPKIVLAVSVYRIALGGRSGFF